MLTCNRFHTREKPAKLQKKSRTCKFCQKKYIKTYKLSQMRGKRCYVGNENNG